MGCASSSPAAAPRGGPPPPRPPLPGPVGSGPKDPGSQQISFRIPPGAKAGHLIEAQMDDGSALQVRVPAGASPGQEMLVECAPPSSEARMPLRARTSKLGADLLEDVEEAPSPHSPRQSQQSQRSRLAPEGQGPVRVSLSKTMSLAGALAERMEEALRNHDGQAVGKVLLEVAASNVLSDPSCPLVLKNAAAESARQLLVEADQSDDLARLKFALMTAKRLEAVELPVFKSAFLKYRQMKKFQDDWNVHKLIVKPKPPTGSNPSNSNKRIINDELVHEQIQRLLDLTHRAVYTRDRMGEPVPERLKLLKVIYVENPEMWVDYVQRRQAIRASIEEDRRSFAPLTVDTCAKRTSGVTEGSARGISASLAADHNLGEPLQKAANEVFLFHGTNEKAAEDITNGNFQINFAGSNTGTLYGRGVYLAENSTKADEYTRPMQNGNRCMLLCRATLGRVFYTDQNAPDPNECEQKCLKGAFHSVLGDRKKSRGTFREFVLFDEEQVYTNYIIVYRRESGIVDERRTLEVKCPPTGLPGQTLICQMPNGQKMRVRIPEGVAPGQKFKMQY